MDILILSRKRSFYATKRLKIEAEKLGYEAEVVDPLKCVICLTDSKPGIIFHKKMLLPKVVIARLSTFATPYSIAVVRQFRFMGIPCINDDEGFSKTRNKLRCLQHLIQNKIKIPDTLIARSIVKLEHLVDRAGGVPVVLKLMSGTQGTGVILTESLEATRSSMEAMWSVGHDIMMQRFISESRGKDIRALVIGNKVVASMYRIAEDNEFRSNIHRGAKGVNAKLSAEYQEVAIKAAKVVGLELAGVDMLESKDGPLVIEVNSSPGFQGLEEATGKNIATAIVKYAILKAKSYNGKKQK